MKKFILEKKENVEEFICSNCDKKKKSKNIAFCNDEKICNGCFGLLLSKSKIIR